MSNRLMAALIVLSFVACAGAPRQPAGTETDLFTEPYPQEQAEVRKLLEDIRDAVHAKDVRRLESFHLYGPKFTKFEAGERQERLDAAEAREGESGVAAVKEITPILNDVRVDVFGPVAIATFLSTTEIVTDTGTVNLKFRDTIVFAKSRGEWKIVHEHQSPFESKG